MKFIINKKKIRIRRSLKFRNKVKSLKINRLVIHRTSHHIYAQIISLNPYMVLVSASTVEKKIRNSLNSYPGNKFSASIIGKIIAQRAVIKGITTVAFDRSGFKYHGRVRTLAESARKYGLKF